GGWRNKPTAITKVCDVKNVCRDLGRPRRVKAFSDGITYEAEQILKKNVLGGTGTRASYGCPAAGKTGTVDDFTDAWFVGWTPTPTTTGTTGAEPPPPPP